MYIDWLVLDGTLKTIDEINKAYMELTGDPDPWYDAEDNGWMGWVEWRDGKTIIKADVAR